MLIWRDSMFGENLKGLREEKKLTQNELAEVLEVTRQAISNYENGREPSYDILIRIAKYFDVTIDYLLGNSCFKTTDEIIFYENSAAIKDLLNTMSPVYKRDFIDCINHFAKFISKCYQSNKSGISSFFINLIDEIENYHYKVSEYSASHYDKSENIFTKQAAFFKFIVEDESTRRKSQMILRNILDLYIIDTTIGKEKKETEQATQEIVE